jgi:hypothetical protein
MVLDSEDSYNPYEDDYDYDGDGDDDDYDD